jgi:NADH dehydrogenase FAD-containing subunit
VNKAPGQLAANGRTGVARIFGLKFSGVIGWALWRIVYLMKLPRLEGSSSFSIQAGADVLSGSLSFANSMLCGRRVRVL